MIKSIKKVILSKCPKLPYQIIRIYENTILILSVIAALAKTIVFILQAVGLYSYGSYYRIFESYCLLCLSISSWLFSKYRIRYAYIYSGIAGIIMNIAYIELVILYNEAEEGLIFFLMFNIVTFVFLDFFRYYFVMVLYYIAMISYVLIRIMVTRPHTSLLSAYDCVFYGGISTLLTCSLYYILLVAFNIIYNEKNKATSILESWKSMMSSSSMGIIIKTQVAILFHNPIAASILSSSHFEMSSKCVDSLLSIAQIVPGNPGKIYKSSNDFCICIETKSIQYDECEALLILITDISEIIGLQKQKHEQQMIEMLVATSTHELRSPLHCIKNTLEFLLEDNSPNKELIERAIGACEMQENYINDMLDYAKYKKNNLVIIKEPMLVGHVLNDVYNYFLYSAQEKGLLLKVDTPTEPILINADFNRTRQILFNLISNSLKFTLSGGITLRASVEQTAVNIQVIDTGIGISANGMKNLFQAFGMDNETRAINKNGTGLGLYLSKIIAQHMGSDITVQSTQGKGSTFSLKFNILSSSTPFNKHAEIRYFNTQIAVSLPESIKAKALVVDDNTFNCKILEKLLLSFGIESLLAYTGITALNLIKESNLLIGFVDINMPMMDGYEVLTGIKEHFNGNVSFPIYALTGDSSEETKQKCKRVGFKGCLFKPFTKSSLQSLLTTEKLKTSLS